MCQPASQGDNCTMKLWLLIIAIMANMYPWSSSSSFGHSRQTSVGERERGLLWFDQSESCGYLCLEPRSGQAIFGTQSCPGLSRASLQPSNGPLCSAWPGLISHFYLNCNVSLSPAPACSCCMMYPNVSKSIHVVSIQCICDECAEYLEILEHSG